MKSNDHGFPLTKLNHNHSFTGLPLSIREKLMTNKSSKSVLYSDIFNSHIHSSYSQITLRNIKEKAGVISTASPYKSLNEIIIEEEKQNRKKWISNKNFKLYVGKRSVNNPSRIRNYVQISPSIPPSNYLFRGVSKDKWIDNNGFKL